MAKTQTDFSFSLRQNPETQQNTPNGTMHEFDKDKAWKAVVVQMAQ